MKRTVGGWRGFLLALAVVLCGHLAHATNYYGGLLNFTLGQATLYNDGSTLTVSNLTHSGNDGFTIEAGHSSALDILYQLLIEDIEKHNTCAVSIVTNDLAPAGMASLGALMGGSAPFVYADFASLGSTQSLLQVRDSAGNLLQTRRIPNGAHIDLNSLFPPKTNSTYLLEYKQGADFVWWRVATPCLDCPGTGSLVERVISLSAVDVRGPVPFISSLRILSQGVEPQIYHRISGENLGLFGHFHQALGQAHFDARGSVLALNNIGSSGNDGVAVLIDPAKNRFKARWNELDSSGAAPAGASFTLLAKGSFTGGVKQTLGSMKIQKLAAGMSLTTDFTAIGSRSALILVMRGGTQVGSFRLNHNTPMSFSGGFPRNATVGPRISLSFPPAGPICFYEDWPIDVAFSFPGGSIIGNQVRVLVDDVTQTLDSISEAQLLLSGLPELQLTGEESSQAGVIFDGLAQAPLGNATLQMDAAAGGLAIANIGASGNDGVRIFTGNGGGATTRLGTFNPGVLPADAFLRWAAIDPNDLKLQQLTVQRTAAGGALFADFTGLGAPTVTVAFYSNDTLIAQASGISPAQPLASFTSGGPSGGGGGLPINLDPCILHPEACYGVLDLDLLQPDPVGPVGSVVTIPGNGPMLCTRMQIQPDFPPLYFVPKYRVKATEITGRNLGTWFVRNEGMIYFDLEHQAVGQSEYSFDVAETFTLGNLGISGNDGMDVMLRNATAYAGDWVALNPQPFPPGGGGPTTFAANGRVNGGSEQLIGLLELSDFGRNWPLVPHFTSILSHSQQIQLMSNGSQVASYSSTDGTTAVTINSNVPPAGLTIRPVTTGSPAVSGVQYSLRWGGSLSMTTPAGEPFTADEVRVTVNDVAVSLDALTRVSYRIAGWAGFQFTNETAAGRPVIQCPTNLIVILPCSSNCVPVVYSTPAISNGALVRCLPPGGTCLPAGTQTIVCLASNAAGQAECTFTVQVLPEPARPPVLQCPTNPVVITLPCTSNCVPIGYSLPGVTNGTLVSCTPPPGTCLTAGVYTVVCRATNLCTEAECTFMVNVQIQQGEPPAIQCPPDITVTTCGAGEVVNYPAPIVSGSAAGDYTVVCVPPSGSFFPPGTNKVVCCATDSCGRKSCCGFNVIVPHGITFAGNQHCPISTATLTIDPAANTLAIGNLSGSGNDGVEIALNQAEHCEVATPFAGSPGDTCRYEYRGVLDGVPDRTAATLTLTRNSATEMQVSGDMSALGTTRYSLLVLDGDRQVVGVSNQPSATFTLGGNAQYVAPYLRCDIRIYKCYIRIKLPKLPNDPGPVIRLAGGAAVSGDSIIILAENPTHDLSAQNRVLLTAKSGAVPPSPRIIVHEELGLFGLGHTGIGAATLTANGSTLTIGNLGTNGDNGVAVDLGSSRDFLAAFVPLDPLVSLDPPHPVPWFEARAFGYFAGAPSQNLGLLRFTSITDAVVQATVDFSALGTSTHTIEVWRGGQLVQRIPGHSGVVAVLSNWPVRIGKLGTLGPVVLPCFIAAFEQPIPIVVDGTSFVGDEMRVLAGSASGSIGDLQRMEFRASAFDSFTIVSESRTPEFPAQLVPRLGGMRPNLGGGLQFTIPTAFGYEYTLESRDSLGAASPWSEAQSVGGDGAPKVITYSSPGSAEQKFFRMRVDPPIREPLPRPGQEPHNIQFFLDLVTVERQRDTGGDRPYFAMIAFQTRLNTLNSTTVQVVEREPHDWVSKDEFNGNGALLKGKDHMLSGDMLPIPVWMGEFEWNNVEWAAPTNLLQLRNTMLMGAIVVGLDNHNTPPNLIRDLLGQVADALKTEFVDQIESGKIINGLILTDPLPTIMTNLEQRFKGLAFDAISNTHPDIVSLLVGSLGDPDIPVGAQFVVFPAIPGIPETRIGTNIPVLSSSIGIGALIRTPELFSTTLRFQGLGAVYVVNARVVPDIVPTLPQNPPPNQDPSLVSTLTIFTHTGEDDLRENSEARVVVGIKGQSPQTFPLNLMGNKFVGFANRSDHFVTVQLSQPTPLAAINSITLTFKGGACNFCTGDNWNVDSLRVDYAGSMIKGTLLIRQGAPLIRFKDDGSTETGTPSFTISH